MIALGRDRLLLRSQGTRFGRDRKLPFDWSAKRGMGRSSGMRVSDVQQPGKPLADV
jgi:hypothetical protein